MSFFSKDRLKQLADNARQAGTRLGTQLQAGVQTAQQQMRTPSLPGAGEGRSVSSAHAVFWLRPTGLS